MPELYFIVGVFIGGAIGFLVQLTVNVEVSAVDHDAQSAAKWRRIAAILLERKQARS